MTRNAKRFLAASLLSLSPSIAFAGQVESGFFLDLLSQRDEYVTVREGVVQVPVLRNSVRRSSPAPSTRGVRSLPPRRRGQ